MAKIFVSYTIVSTGNWFLVIREQDALAEKYRSPLLVPPHGLRNVAVDNLNPVMHQVELWTTLDGVTLNTMRGRCEIDASQYSDVAFDTITFIAGRGLGAPHYDPAPDPNDQYDNENLAGEDYIVFKPGFGPLIWDVHIEKVLTGGFKYINGQVFGDGEEYTLIVNNATTAQVTQSGNGYPEGVVEINNNVDLSAVHYKKLLEVTASMNITVTIPDIDTIPDGTVFGVNTHSLPNANLKYVTLQLPVGKYCMVNGQQENAVYVGRAEEITLIKKGDYLRIVNWDGDYRRVGQRADGDGVAPTNSLPRTGGWYSQSQYPRIFNWHVLKIPLSELGTGLDDSVPDEANRARWIIGATKFWVPDHGGYVTRVLDPNADVDPQGGSRVANSLQLDDNKEHNHVIAPYNRAIARASDVDNTNTPSGVDSSNPTTEYRVAAMDLAKWGLATIVNSGGSEARMKNVAAAGYVII
jgi:hypothetical protein